MVAVPILFGVQRSCSIPVHVWRELNRLGVSCYFDRSRHGGLSSLHDDLLSKIQEQAISGPANCLAIGGSTSRAKY